MEQFNEHGRSRRITVPETKAHYVAASPLLDGTYMRFCVTPSTHIRMIQETAAMVPVPSIRVEQGYRNAAGCRTPGRHRENSRLSKVRSQSTLYQLWNVLYSADRRTYPVPTYTGSDNELIGNHGALWPTEKGLHYMRSCDADLARGLDPATQDDEWTGSHLFAAQIISALTKFDWNVEILLARVVMDL